MIRCRPTRDSSEFPSTRRPSVGDRPSGGLLDHAHQRAQHFVRGGDRARVGLVAALAVIMLVISVAMSTFDISSSPPIVEP